MADLFGAPVVRIDEVLHELLRELAMRERMYPRWVAQKSLSPKAADRQLGRLRRAIELIEGLQKTGSV